MPEENFKILGIIKQFIFKIKYGEIYMTLDDECTILQEIDEVNDDVLNEVRNKAFNEAYEEGIQRGKIQIALNLKDVLDDEEISRRTGLSHEKIRKLFKRDEVLPPVHEVVAQAIREVNLKALSEAEFDGRKEGKQKGIENEKLEIARNFKDIMSDEEISRRTGLSLEKVRNL